VGEWNSETAVVGRATSSMVMIVRVSERRVWKYTKPVDQLVEVALVDCYAALHLFKEMKLQIRNLPSL